MLAHVDNSLENCGDREFCRPISEKYLPHVILELGVQHVRPVDELNHQCIICAHGHE